jgi:HK97 family phage major capsid protein
MPVDVTKLQEQRLHAWEEMKSIADKAAEEKRDMSGDEEQTWQRANADVDAIDKRVRDLLDSEKRNQDAQDAFAELEKRAATREVAPEVRKDEEAEVRKFFSGEAGRHAEYRGRFPSAEQRTVSSFTPPLGAVKQTATAGGNTVPTSFYDRLVQHLIFNSAVLQLGVTVLNTDSGEALQIPKTTAHPTASLVAEEAVIGESDAVFGQVTLGAYKFGNLLSVSRELIADSGVDLLGYLSQISGSQLGNAFGTYAVTGTGSSQPTGIKTVASSGVVSANTGAVGAFTADDVINLLYSVAPQYRNQPNAAWLLSDTALSAIRKFKNTTQGYIWQPSYQAGQPDLLLAKPVVEDPNVDAVAVNAKSVFFGDWSRFYVRMVGPIRFERSDDFYFNQDTVAFRAILRADCNLVDTTGAIKYLQSAAT